VTVLPCACNKNRATASGVAAVAGTYRVLGPNGRKVYETTNGDAAKAVAARFDNATVLAPGETA
jgi:hypothetical protein